MQEGLNGNKQKKREKVRPQMQEISFENRPTQAERQAVLPQPKHKKRLRMMRLRRRPVTAM